MNLAQVQTVSDWINQGYRGLRIMRCAECLAGTYRTWAELGASPQLDIIEAARRVRCDSCGIAPAGLAVVTYRDMQDAFGRRHLTAN